MSLRTPLRRPVMIESSLTVPRLGFVPGETIAVVVRVERARRKVKAASLHLVQVRALTNGRPETHARTHARTDRHRVFVDRAILLMADCKVIDYDLFIRPT